ncbi:MAG TPA: glycerol-3-phosphate acyltransferase [Candidatus Dormibacteraeota bacterium]|jgi:glycerol-3-phosphate acyltransferase PlsY|nr:glycerol-3-phosphate acyltransferase [Candidatus Dormibacteraeota bacterium]
MAVASMAPGTQPLVIVLTWAGAYLVGGVPIGWMVGKLAGVDLREVGTHKIGTSNLFHTVGLLPAAVVGPLQFCQGLLPVLVAVLLGGPAWVAAGAGLAAVIGNGWPIYMQYNGGRGVASATGAVALWSWGGIAFVLILVIIGGALRRSALGVLLAYAGLPVVLWLTRASPAFAITAVGIVICLILRRFEGYRVGRARPDDAPDSWVTRLLFDRVTSGPTVAIQPIDSE